MTTSIKTRLYVAGAAKLRNYLSALLQKDILFAWIPKSAGTSIFDFLAQNGGRRFYTVPAIKLAFPNRGIATFGHLKLLDLLDNKIISEKYFRSAYKFSFVRNPYDRTVSIFFYYRRIGRIDKGVEFKRFCETIFKRDYSPCGLFNDQDLSHCNPQSSYIFNNDDQPIVDFIGHFETLEDDLAFVAKTLGLEYNCLERLNASAHEHFMEYYDDESLELIKRAYERDFRLLNYETVVKNVV